MSRYTKGLKELENASRRRFLGYLGSTPFVALASSPAAALFGTILGGQSQKAWAESLGLKPRNFVRILEGGAPPRWMYDSFLTPYSTAGFNRNPMVATQFSASNGRYMSADYVTYNVKGVQVPTMWTHDLPTSDGGYRPMADLLDNLLSLQGITTRNAGHGSSQLWAWTPPGAKQSTSALSGDASSAPFAGLNLGASSYDFKSAASKTSVSPSMSGNWISNLLGPFQPAGTAQFKTSKGSIKEAYKGLLPLFDSLAKQGNVGAAALIENRNSALALVETNFAGLDVQWTGLVNKYKSLVSRAIYDPSHPLAGVNDLPIGEGGTGAMLLYQVDGGANMNLHLASDVRSAIGPSTNVPGLAERFAFTEYVLLNNLSTSIAFSIGSLTGLVRESDKSTAFSLGNDQHNTGIFPATYFNILRHRAGAACIMELIARLKAVNAFNDTVICVSGEFNRTPRQDMTGSDHGFNGTSQAFYSGAFNGPLMVGNLANDGRLGWGAGGSVPELGRQLNLVDSTVTIAHLLRVTAPLTSTNSVVTLSSSGLVSNIGNTRFV